MLNGIFSNMAAIMSERPDGDRSYYFYEDDDERDKMYAGDEEATIKASQIARKTVINQAVKSLEHVSSALLSLLVSGQSRLDMSIGQISVSLKKDTGYHLSHEFFSFDLHNDKKEKQKTRVAGGIKIPPVCQTTLPCSPDDSLGIMMFQTPVNPYYWHKSASLVSTSVLGLSLFDNFGDSLAVEDLTHPLVLIIPRPQDTQSKTRYLPTTLTQQNERWNPQDLARFTSDVSCGQNYQISLTLPANFTRISLLLVIKTETTVFVRDFFGDPKSDGNLARFVIDFSQNRLSTVNEPNDPGVTHLVETNGVVRIFGLISSKESRCRVFLGLLPKYYDSARCTAYCKKGHEPCGFCRRNITWNTKVEMPSENTARIEVMTLMSECLYWHEKDERWTNQGCKVSPSSTESTIVCECSHMSSFSGSFFVQPNRVDVFNLSLFLNIFRNPIVIAVVMVTWCIYILFIVWARRKDKEDRLKHGVIIPADNAPDDHYCYLVTVITGWKTGAGTTSTVAMCMSGMLGTTSRHLLEQQHKLIHEKGAENWFLIATHKCLGDLRTVKVWHSCSGLFPSWYLNQITVRDLQTNEVWDFICNDWLSPNNGRESVSRILYADNKGTKRYHFNLMAVQSLRNEHSFLSILSPPTHSTFTRVQRLSCVMAFVMLAMLTNIMFYGEPPAQIEETAKGSIILTWDQLRIALMAFVITIPATLIIVAIFTNVRPKYTCEDSYRVRRFNVVDTKTPWWKKRFSKQLHPVEFDPNQEHKHLERYDHQLLITLDDVKKKSFPSSDDSDTQLSTAGADQAKSDEDLGEYLPWWFYYIGWFLTIMTAVVSSYVTVMYSLTYGQERSISWTISFFATVFQENGILEPTKIAIVAAFVTFIAGTRAGPHAPSTYTLNSSTDSEFLTALEDRGEVSKEPRLRMHLYTVPGMKRVATAVRVMKLDARLWKVLYDVGMCLVFGTFLAFVTRSQRHEISFVLNKSIVNTFVNAKYSRNITLNEVNTVDDIWKYLRYSFVPSLYNDEVTRCIADGQNYVVGPIRLRQSRVRPELSHNSTTTDFTRKICWTPFNKNTEDRASYGLAWKKCENVSELNTSSAWIYHRSTELTTRGGYVLLLSTKKHSKIMLRSLRRLQDRNWIDDKTRLFFIEFTLFNPTTRIFVTVTLSFECISFGNVYSHSNIATLQLYDLTSVSNFSITTIVIVYVYFLLWFTYNVGRTMWEMRQHLFIYMTSVWTYIEWLIMVLSYGAITVFAQRINVAKQSVALFREGNDDVFVSFYPAVFLEYLFVYFIAIILTLLMLNILKLSVYVSKRHVLFTSAISGAAVSVGIIACIYVVTFLITIVMSTILFSDSCEGYSNISSTVLRVLKLYIYDMSTSSNGCVNDHYMMDFLFFGVSMFVVAMLWRPLLIICGINLLVKPSKLSKRTVNLQEDINFVNFLWSRFLVFVGYWKLNDFTEYLEHLQTKKYNLHVANPPRRVSHMKWLNDLM